MSPPENRGPDELQLLAYRLHMCGKRVIYEFLKDIRRGRSFDDTVKDFSRIDPVHWEVVSTFFAKDAAK